MPSETASRMRASTRPALDLPPPFRLITLREVGDAFSHATKVAAEGGAGTLVYVGRFDLAEFAVVLEPEEPLKTARRALYAGLTALADAAMTVACAAASAGSAVSHRRARRPWAADVDGAATERLARPRRRLGGA